MVVGITGNIGAGKSTLAQMLVDKGASLVDADHVGHEVIETDAVHGQLTDLFGEGILGFEGRLDRRELGRLAFADEASRDALNQIVHPPLVREVWSRVQRLSRAADCVVVVDAALLFEWGELDRFDLIVVVRAEIDSSIRRVSQRLGLTAAEVRRRMRSQLPVSEKARLADAVIDNDGDIDHLAVQADQLWQRILSLANSDSGETEA